MHVACEENLALPRCAAAVMKRPELRAAVSQAWRKLNKATILTEERQTACRKRKRGKAERKRRCAAKLKRWRWRL